MENERKNQIIRAARAAAKDNRHHGHSLDFAPSTFSERAFYARKVLEFQKELGTGELALSNAVANIRKRSTWRA